MELITGIDEVGRGPLAGPVVAAAVSQAIADAETLWKPERFDGVFPVKGFGIRRLCMYDLCGISSPGMNYTIAHSRPFSQLCQVIQSDRTPVSQ